MLIGILSSAMMPTAMAHIGDRESEEDRGSGMGLMSAVIGVGVILGPRLGSLLASQSISLPFFFAAALSTFTLLPILLALPESLPPQARRHRKTCGRGLHFITGFKKF